ncbi:MAG: LytR C-terminal domain-containing protein [Euzebyales bacterium]|jgi:hypothetical protein|nr:LytR C-terminal domain-containing protein [Euzebyales bacterium]
MARHAHPDRRAYYSSLAAAVGKGLAAVLVVVAVTVAAILLVDPRDEGPLVVMPTGAAPTDVAAAATPTGPAEASPQPTATDGETTPPLFDPTTGATPSPGITADGGTEDPDAASPGEIDPTAVTVQVLDGGAGDERTEAAVAALQELGYEIVAVNPARCCYEETTVLFSDGNEDLAVDLTQRDERFVTTGPNPNLTEDVDIHVVVGQDWPG